MITTVTKLCQLWKYFFTSWICMQLKMLQCKWTQKALLKTLPIKKSHWNMCTPSKKFNQMNISYFFGMLWMLSPILTTFQILVFLGLVTFVQWKKHKWVLFCFPLPCVPGGYSGCSPIPEVGLNIWSKAPHFTKQPPVGPVNNNWEGDMIRKATSCFSKWEQWHWELWMKCFCTVFNIFFGFN